MKFQGGSNGSQGSRREKEGSKGFKKVPKGSISFNMVQEALKWYTMALKVQYNKFQDGSKVSNGFTR